MKQLEQRYTDILASIFTDETENFRRPAEPNPGDEVFIRLRVKKGEEVKVTLLLGDTNEQLEMVELMSDEVFDWYAAAFECDNKTLTYSFLLDFEGRLVYYDRMGAQPTDHIPAAVRPGAFRIIPGFHVPDWAKGAVQYQILPDRFRRGNPDNDVKDREYVYSGGFIRHAASWDALPESDDYRCMYGGDLAGVLEKLDYLQSLGVEAIYLNPIFISPSPHKYDAQDYEHIDPHLTVVEIDGGQTLDPDDWNNAHASLYIRRTTDARNLQKSNEWFADFCQEVHLRDMKIILDGVFNHCGSFHYWMNREGLYSGGDGAFGNPDSPFRDFFAFENDYDYDSWWDINTLPKLHYEQSVMLREAIMKVAVKWASPPYNIDGWRLDVAADLGMSREYNHTFWKEFRRRVKAVNPDVVIIAEHYGDPAEWLRGDEWDTVMNYDAFMDPVSFFLTGMEKHSDYRRDDLYQNGDAFFHNILEAMARMPAQSSLCAMDELSNHDHSRFMTRTNGRAGRVNTVGNEAADEGIQPGVFREAAVIQMTWPGAPTIYYGDEAGVAGWTDPDNRRTYPWGHEDQSLIRMYRELAKIREEYPVLRCGSLKPLCAGWGYIAYARFNAHEYVITVCNNTEEAMELKLPVRTLGITDGTPVFERYCTSECSSECKSEAKSEAEHSRPRKDALGCVKDGRFLYCIPPQSASILTT